jgi:SM-20-related protein
MDTQLNKKIIDGLVSDSYIIIENALDEGVVTQLLHKAQEEQFYKKAAISKDTKEHIDTTKRSDKTKWLNEDDKETAPFFDFTNSLKNSLNRELFLGLSYYEAHFAIYEEGDFYEKHLDAFKNSKNKVVTTVL